MEASFKHSMDGTEGVASRENSAPVKMANRNTVSSSDFLLRILTVITSLVAIIVMATSKQTTTVPVTVIQNLPPINVQVTAKWHYMSAFVFFMVTNCIAVVYGVISLALSIANRTGSSALGLLLVILDMMIMALLFSANGAAASVGVIAYHGNSHVQWGKVCNVFESNCRHVAASIAVSLIGSAVFFCIIILTVVNLLKKSH